MKRITLKRARDLYLQRGEQAPFASDLGHCSTGAVLMAMGVPRAKLRGKSWISELFPDGSEPNTRWEQMPSNAYSNSERGPNWPEFSEGVLTCGGLSRLRSDLKNHKLIKET